MIWAMGTRPGSRDLMTSSNKVQPLILNLAEWLNMLELFLVVLLGVFAVLAAFFLRPSLAPWRTAAPNKQNRLKEGNRSRSLCARRKSIPRWNNHPADSEMGDLRTAVSCGSLHHYLLQQHSGGRCPATAFWWRKQRVVSVCSPQAFKDTENLYNRPKLIFAQCSEPLHGSDSIQSINYTDWEERKKLLYGTIRGRNLESFFNDFVQIAQETEKMWFPNKPIELMKEMFRMTLKAILCTSLGNIFEDNGGIEWLANLYHLCKCEMDHRILDVPPPNSQQELDFQENLKQLKSCLRRMAQVRKEQNHSKKLPLLDALLQSGASSSEEQVLSDMVTFMGGFHTSAFYATWTFFYLARNPKVQENLFREVKEKVRGEHGEKLQAYTQTSISFVRQVLDEALRMSTTAPFSAHYSDQDMIVDGYHVPAKTPIIHAIGVVLKNEAIWENPERFDPDRFSPGSKHAKRGPEFRPFGIPHARRCPANQFTYFMVSIFVTILVQRFIFLTVDEQMPEKKHGIATSPKDGIYIQVKFRDQE